MAIRAPEGAKNSHILPTGQWYSPSEVINDYARVCKSMPEYARVCQSMPEYARVLPSFAKVVPKSSPDGSESERPMLLLRTGVI